MEPIVANALPLSYRPFLVIPPLTIQTERLLLIASDVTHKDLVFSTYSNSEIATKYMAWPRVIHPDDGVPFLALVENSFKGLETNNPQFSWVIKQKSDGACIGACGFGKLTDDSISGGYIFAPHYWRNGYATEVWQTLVELGKSMPLVRRIEATHHPDNPQSGKVMMKVGMVRVGEFPDIGYYPQVGSGKLPSVVWEWTRPTSL